MRKQTISSKILCDREKFMRIKYRIQIIFRRFEFYDRQKQVYDRHNDFYDRYYGFCDRHSRVYDRHTGFYDRHHFQPSIKNAGALIRLQRFLVFHHFSAYTKWHTPGSGNAGWDLPSIRRLPPEPSDPKET